MGVEGIEVQLGINVNTGSCLLSEASVSVLEQGVTIGVLESSRNKKKLSLMFYI